MPIKKTAADGNADGYGEDKQDDEGAECGKKNRIHIISFYYTMLDVLRYLIDTAQNGLDTHEAEACGHGHPDDPGRQLHGGVSRSFQWMLMTDSMPA